MEEDFETVVSTFNKPILCIVGFSATIRRARDAQQDLSREAPLEAYV